MFKCDFCKKEKKELRIIWAEDDEFDLDFKICKDCIKVEAPNLVWRNLQKYKIGLIN